MAECARCKVCMRFFEGSVPLCSSCTEELKEPGKGEISVVSKIDLSTSQIDEAVLSVTPPVGKKVALVISQAIKVLENKLPEGEAAFDLIEKRIEALVQDGRLLLRGDIKNWHYSRVRKSK